MAHRVRWLSCACGAIIAWARHAEKLKAVGGRLYLSGMSEAAYDQVVESGRIKLMGPLYAYEAEPVIWQSTTKAATDARTWLVGQGKDASGTKDSSESKTPEGQPS